MEKIIKKYAVCIGYRMRQERKNKNITQQELAHRLGISYSYYNKLDIKNPIIRINTGFKGYSSTKKVTILPRIYHN